MASDSVKVPKFTLKRLPLYYRYLRNCVDRKLEFVSSEQIAKAAQVNAVQVRKDLTMFGAMGTPGVGYNVLELQSKLEDILGLNNINEAALVGVGRLGRAIIDYPGFERYGLNIVALFDNNPSLIGTQIAGRQVFSVKEMLHIIRRLKLKVAIITVPGEWAQSIANVLVEAGIKAIWNFAPVSLDVPEDVVVRNEDLAAGLATLFHYLAEIGS
ncbi:MAG TPA: redox-sensing transcriptional repressor Rex [Bacillota bacterium]|jgi:redox-sensing transcriptional repressor|nr:redox-sensing transcriptional repressor Rex [Bacillota bacterium]HOL09609.1 redox-sensing transcriptional repressor Rex [Bacillota bacterium]HPO97604.1 redox-sensing transcriptional repressor Rex [Bacillota bacterium]